MATTTKTATFSLKTGGFSWSFMPEAFALLNIAGFAPWLLAVVVKPEAGLNEVSLKGVGVFLVTRRGRKITVTAKPKGESGEA